MKRSLSVFAIFALACASHAQELATSYESSEVAPGIYMLTGVGGFGGGNVGLLVGDDHIVMIDDTMVPTAPTLIAAAAEITARPIDFVINTHVHGDHAGGNATLAEGGTIVVAHDNIRKRLLDDPEPAGGPGGLPVITFADGMTFHVNSHDAHVFHVMRAHTDGDAVIHFRNANVIHTGDVMFNGIFPFIDLDNGGSVDGFIAAARAIHDLANARTRIIPGHGPLASKADLAAFIEMLEATKNSVKVLVDAGKSEDEILAANPLAQWESLSWSFITTERMTRTLIRDLSSGNER